MITHHPAIRAWLDQLDAALTDVAPTERRDITTAVEEHLAARLGPTPSGQEITAALEDLGSPAAVAAEANAPARPVAPSTPGLLDSTGFALTGVIVLALTGLGTLVPLVYLPVQDGESEWLILLLSGTLMFVGAPWLLGSVLIVMSRRFTWGYKLFAVLWPGLTLGVVLAVAMAGGGWISLLAGGTVLIAGLALLLWPRR